MQVLYTFCLYLGMVFFRLLSLFDRRFRSFFRERKKKWALLKASPALQKRPLVWVHAASLGEFEQIRPLLELLRSKHPELSLLLTFFSPSGYRLRANYEEVDGVAYLPLDFPKQMRHFFKLLQPALGLLVKYEFWPNMCRIAAKHQVPLLSVGAFFNAEQFYFRQGMGFFRSTLRSLSGFLVQDAQSARLLRSIGCKQIEAVGDPRYDGVRTAADQVADFPILDRFRDKSKLLMVWGSVWPDEWAACAQAIAQTPELQHIIAPHQLQKPFLERIRARFPKQVLRYSAYDQDLSEAQSPSCLLIDNIGMLARVYRYADLAYVGGGKRGALHNILEPAVYGVPVLFWAHKANKKFPEAAALQLCGGADAVRSAAALRTALSKWTQTKSNRKQAAKAAAEFVDSRLGATEKIYNYLKKLPALNQKNNHNETPLQPPK